MHCKSLTAAQHKHCSLILVPQTHSIWKNKWPPKTSHLLFLLSAGTQWYWLNMCLANICLQCFLCIFTQPMKILCFTFDRENLQWLLMSSAFIPKLFLHLLPICSFFWWRTLEHTTKTYLHTRNPHAAITCTTSPNGQESWGSVGFCWR